MQRRLCFLRREVFSIRYDALFFEVNEAVIIMIIQGRSPTMRHVSRTQSCAWLVAWQNQPGRKNQIKFVDTKNQFADMLTKGHFTRDEWNNLLHLFNISIFCAQQAAPKRRRKECKKEQEKRELWQSRSRRWTWSRVMRQALPHRQARVRPVTPGYSEPPSQQSSNLIAQCAGNPAALGSNQKWRSVKFSSVANSCKVERIC